MIVFTYFLFFLANLGGILSIQKFIPFIRVNSGKSFESFFLPFKLLPPFRKILLSLHFVHSLFLVLIIWLWDFSVYPFIPFISFNIASFKHLVALHWFPGTSLSLTSQLSNSAGCVAICSIQSFLNFHLLKFSFALSLANFSKCSQYSHTFP